ncbi:hypothetical protein T4E_93 [Trichinella pseudospiralis]|uniref:Uncharacterized protein n=1 Tax=Trichinella pseudospiralis TaxID=6337 RepID=A0A0V0XFK7_TRIPS|nr:hypothetical protein T4E_93 [Trichinella pseudospiralis]
MFFHTSADGHSAAIPTAITSISNSSNNNNIHWSANVGLPWLRQHWRCMHSAAVQADRCCLSFLLIHQLSYPTAIYMHMSVLLMPGNVPVS